MSSLVATLVFLALSLVSALRSSAQTFSFDDIEFWVGDGANRAALVIDWNESDSSTPALVWGYRWDGEATGADMLVKMVVGDDRLFAKLGDSPSSIVRTFGLGYDADGDGEFGIDDGTPFNVNGLAFSGPADLATATDAGDYYAEGWFTGFWHYGISSADPYDGGVWSDTALGMASRPLADGAWDSWVFSPSFDFGAFAENPVAALPPTLLPGDFNGDEIIDALDYGVWKSAFGSQSELSADANANGIVDAADYTIWRDHFLGEASAATALSHSVPEPATWLFAVVALGMLFTRRCELYPSRQNPALPWGRLHTRRSHFNGCPTV